jgi:hypothetical protein
MAGADPDGRQHSPALQTVQQDLILGLTEAAGDVAAENHLKKGESTAYGQRTNGPESRTE